MAKFKRTLYFFEYWFENEEGKEVNFDFKQWLETVFENLPKQSPDGTCTIQPNSTKGGRSQFARVQSFAVEDDLFDNGIFIRWSNISAEGIQIMMDNDGEETLQIITQNQLDASHITLLLKRKRFIVCKSNHTPGGGAFVQYINKIFSKTNQKCKMRYAWMVQEESYQESDVVKKIKIRGKGSKKTKKSESIGDAMIKSLCKRMGLSDDEVNFTIEIKLKKRGKMANLVQDADKFKDIIAKSPKEEKLSFVRMEEDKYGPFSDLFLSKISLSTDFDKDPMEFKNLKAYDFIFHKMSLEQYIAKVEGKWDNGDISKVIIQ